MLYGLNAIFFNFTSLPYTEGLGFALAFAALLALDRSVSGRRALGWAGAAGALAALAYLARVQMVMVIPAVVGALALSGLRRRERLAAAGVAAAAAVLVVLPWVLHLASFIRPFEPSVLLEFGAYRETPEIERFDSRFPIGPGWWARLRDFALGLRASFDPFGGVTSYAGSFGLAAFVVPMALLHLALSRHRWRQIAGVLVGSEGAVVTATAAAAAAMVLPLHFLHLRFLWEWRFGFRHGLSFGLLVLVAVAYLLAYGEPLVRRAALVLVAVALVSGSVRTAEVLTAPRGWGLFPPEEELVAWLDAQNPRPVVLTTNAQTLSVYSRAGFHWMECRESAEKTRTMLRLLPIDYVLVYQVETSCPFIGGVPELAPVRKFGEGADAVWVLAPRRGGSAGPESDASR
jgi:4-amino-4-deoxy-L-arabinose transferase-like glycosyltransferase